MDIKDDIKEVLAEVTEYLKQSAGNGWENVKEQGLAFVADTEDRLTLVANEALTGNLDPQFLVERGKEELTILEEQAIALGIMSASFTQGVINNVTQGFLVTIVAALIQKLKEKLDNL